MSEIASNLAQEAAVSLQKQRELSSSFYEKIQILAESSSQLNTGRLKFYVKISILLLGIRTIIIPLS